MWRTGDVKTSARYRHVGDTKRNRARAVYGWYGEFAAKLNHYPAFATRVGMRGNLPWYGSLSNFEQVKSGCGGGRPFAWFLRRFRQLYEDGGMIPTEIFMLREEKTGKCLRYIGSAGTSRDGYGAALLQPCASDNHRFFWHRGNKDLSKGGACCSGLRAWNTDQCIVSGGDGRVQTAVCDVSGRNGGQFWRFDDNSQLSKRHTCLGSIGEDQISESPCMRFRSSGASRWSKQARTMPLETQLYQKAQREQPRLFGALGVQHIAMEKRAVPATCRGTSHCVIMQDNTGRCLDENALLTTARDYCTPFVIKSQTPSAAQAAAAELVHVETGKCLDRMGNEGLGTWDFRDCGASQQQSFAVLPNADSTTVCATTQNGDQQCLEANPLVL